MASTTTDRQHTPAITPPRVLEDLGDMTCYFELHILPLYILQSTMVHGLVLLSPHCFVLPVYEITAISVCFVIFNT